MQQRYWMAQNLYRIGQDLELAAQLLANLTRAHERQKAHQIISEAKFEMGIASEFTGLGSGGSYQPYDSMVDHLEIIEDKLHEPIEPAEAAREGARLRQLAFDISNRLTNVERDHGSTKELGLEFNNKTLAQAYAEGEEIGAKLLNPDLPTNLRFE